VLADQSAGHGVTVAADVDQATLIDLHAQPLARLQPPRRQRPQHRQLLGQPRPPARIELLQDLTQELGVRLPAVEGAATPQQQRLVHRLLEAAVPLLDVPILVGVVSLDLLPRQSIVGQQRLVAPRELLLVAQVVDRGAQAVGAMPLRHASQLPQGVLQPLAEALEALGKTDRYRLPIGVGQHQVVHQVGERLALDRHAQGVHVREVTGAQPAGFMQLGEEDFLGWPGLGPPAPNVPLQGPQLAIGKPPGVAPLQLVEDGLGLQSGIDLQQGTDLGPDFHEGIGACAPGVPRGQFAGELAVVQVFAGRLLIHVRQQGATGQGGAGGLEAKQFADLLVRDHAQASLYKELALAYAAAEPGKLIVVKPTRMAVAYRALVVVVREVHLSPGRRNSCR
jgi:hypothetical protein